jgi:hypothetical protein
MTTYGPSEHVFVENDWYDGPRAGVANVNGKPHRFVSLFDEGEDKYLGTFLIWPIEQEELALEQEQWEIFVNWNDLYELGVVNTDSHPGHPGTNKRWDELSLLLEPRRKSVPPSARRAEARMVPLAQEKRYESTGTDYQLSWLLL